VDAGVDRVIVRPLAWLSASVLWRGIDRAIEGAYVHGSAALARVTGAAHDWVGRGDVGRYAWAFTIGLLLMLAAFTVR
jgi:hypothetical protein